MHKIACHARCLARRTVPIRASSSGNTVTQDIFDRQVKRIQRDNAALQPDAANFDYLRNEDTIVKFPTALDLGCGPGCIRKHLSDRGGVRLLYQCDMSPQMVHRARNLVVTDPVTPPSVSLVADEEDLPFRDESFDLVMSNLSLHWVNDLPGVLTKVRKCLKPDGMFLGAMLGGSTLTELRTALILADQDLSGGVAAHISPMVGVADAGNLLGTAGFSLISVDVDTIKVEYKDAYELMHHLQAMGEGNAIKRRKQFVSKKVFDLAAKKYKGLFGTSKGVEATFQVIFLCGWSPHSSQQQPKERGSASYSLADLATSSQGYL